MEKHGISRTRPGVTVPERVSEYLGERATLKRLPPVHLTAERSLSLDLEEWEGQLHAWTWPYPSEQMRAACGAIRAWAATSGWPLERVVQLQRTIQWWAFQRNH